MLKSAELQLVVETAPTMTSSAPTMTTLALFMSKKKMMTYLKLREAYTHIKRKKAYSRRILKTNIKITSHFNIKKMR